MSSRLQEPSGLRENSRRAALKCDEVGAERVSLSALGARGDANKDAGLRSFVEQQTAGRRRKRKGGDVNWRAWRWRAVISRAVMSGGT